MCVSDLTVDDLKPLCDKFEADVAEGATRRALSQGHRGGSSPSVLEQCAVTKYLEDTEGEMTVEY